MKESKEWDEDSDNIEEVSINLKEKNFTNICGICKKFANRETYAVNHIWMAMNHK